MLTDQLSHIAEITGGQMLGADVAVCGVSTDSRRVRPGNLFVALRGERFDAHDFLEDVAAAGAAAVLVEEPPRAGIPACVVANSLRAMGELAGDWRQRQSTRVVGITGSNGKTTVKEMVSAMLATQGEVLSTRGNLNNEIGVPLTLFQLSAEHAYAVVEMGAAREGDIRYLTQFVKPEVAILTNAGPAHLAGFGDMAGVARGKGEIFEALDSDGWAIINADDDFADHWRQRAEGRRQLSFGIKAGADVRAEAIQVDGFRLVTPTGSYQVPMSVPGRHNVMNALAAFAAVHALGVPMEQAIQGLAHFSNVPGRLVSIPGRRGARILDDSYNANPSSMRAGIEVLVAAGGEPWLVMGDMAELGGRADMLHAEMGAFARRAGVRRLFTIGDMARFAAKSFGEGALTFDNKEALIAAVRAELAEPAVVLVKGSRCMAMEQVARALGETDTVGGMA